MPNMIGREQAEALIQEQIQQNIIQGATAPSIVLQLAKKLPAMTSNVTRMRVLDMLPMAYWVNGDTGFKKTSRQAWDNVFINAEELAVIVPIPEAVLNDSSIDIMGEVLPRVNEAFGQKVDQAVVFGVDKPSGWGADLITRARVAGNNVPYASGSDLYSLILGENGVFGKVEEKGYLVNGVMSATTMKAKLRSVRSNDGTPIFKSDMQGATTYALDGAPMFFPTNGAYDRSYALMIAGDFSQLVYSIRQDVAVKILTEAVIQDPATNEIVYNLAQQDMIALRVTFRLGFALPTYATRMDEDGLGCPFAYLEPATPVTAQSVTYTVKDGTGDTAKPIAGAIVNIAGSKIKTNESGVATALLSAGTYNVTVKAEGYTTAADTLTVAAAAVTKAIALAAK